MGMIAPLQWDEDTKTNEENQNIGSPVEQNGQDNKSS